MSGIPEDFVDWPAIPLRGRIPGTSIRVEMGIVLVAAILFALGLPSLRRSREESACKDNLKKIGLALHNYESAYGCFPPAFVADRAGKPIHSWRVLILPYLGEQALYNAYNFAEPWDGPNNRRLAGRMPSAYTCPSDGGAIGAAHTSYLAIRGPEAAFEGARPRQLREFTGGTNQTLIVAEAVDAGIPWMAPDDLEMDRVSPSLADPGLLGIGSHHRSGVNLLFANGTPRTVKRTLDPVVMKGLMTISGQQNASGGY